MNSRHDQRHEKYSKHLRVDRLLHFFLCHSHFHKNIKAILIFISFGNLLVVHNQHSTEQEYRSEKHSEEKQSAVERNEISFTVRFTVRIIICQRISHPIALFICRFGYMLKRFQNILVNLYLFFFITFQIKVITFFQGKQVQCSVLQRFCIDRFVRSRYFFDHRQIFYNNLI